MKYICPMCPEVISDQPGLCPKCGMTLELKKEGEHPQMKHGGLEAASDFLRRFLVVTFLLVPLFLLSPKILEVLGLWGLWGFWGRKYFQFFVASAIFYFSLIFFEHARHEIKAKKYGMMTLVSLAVGAGYLFSAASTFIPALGGVEFYLEISTLIWVLLFGHFLEARSSAAAGDALQEVAKLLPKQAHRIKGKTVEDVDLTVLKEGDIVLVKPGEKVPADGVIIKGKANMDEALISGESKPVSKKEGQGVVAGSICLDGSLEVRLTRVGETSTIGQIKKLIEEAGKTKPSMQKLADRAASFLTFSALTVAIATILVWSAILAQPLVFSLTLAITVLVIACPHALGLAIPTVSTIATQLAVKNGLFLKDLAKLEAVKNVAYVVLDKTGTLTKGEFGVVKIIRHSGNPAPDGAGASRIPRGSWTSQDDAINDSDGEILQIAASLEQHSSHVIGASIVKYAKEEGISLREVEDFKNIGGKGVLGKIGGKSFWVGNKTLAKERGLFNLEVEKNYQELTKGGKTVVLVGNQSQVLSFIILADKIREESYKAVSGLHKLGVKVAMLTGDNQQVAKAVASELAIDTYFAEVLPEDKYKYIRKLQEEGNKVMMVGDGVNDAPAITSADVGVAVGAGTEVAVEAGDIVLTRNNPQDIPRLIILAKIVYNKMVQNLFWATAYNLLAIPAAAGAFAKWGIFLRPEIGAILMSLSSVIVVINAITLKKARLIL